MKLQYKNNQKYNKKVCTLQESIKKQNHFNIKIMKRKPKFNFKRHQNYLKFISILLISIFIYSCNGRKVNCEETLIASIEYYNDTIEDYHHMQYYKFNEKKLLVNSANDSWTKSHTYNKEDQLIKTIDYDISDDCIHTSSYYYNSSGLLDSAVMINNYNDGIGVTYYVYDSDNLLLANLYYIYGQVMFTDSLFRNDNGRVIKFTRNQNNYEYNYDENGNIIYRKYNEYGRVGVNYYEHDNKKNPLTQIYDIDNDILMDFSDPEHINKNNITKVLDENHMVVTSIEYEYNECDYPTISIYNGFTKNYIYTNN